MSRSKASFSASNAGASRYIKLNGDQGGGSKKQGLASSIGRVSGLNYNGTYGKDRNVVFHINQLGGVGKGRSMFSSNADGVQTTDSIGRVIPIPPDTDSSNQNSTLTFMQDTPIIHYATHTPVNTIGAKTYFSADLSNLDGNHAGKITGELTTIHLDDSESRHRKIVFNLIDGDIITLGIAKYQKNNQNDFLNNDVPSVSAVIGGTGMYIGSRGVVTTIKKDNGTYTHRFIFVGDLIPTKETVGY